MSQNIELFNVDFENGTAEVGVSDGDNWVGLDLTFDAVIRYVDDSFSHAFGIHKCGHWEIEMDSFKFEIADSDGEPVAIDQQAIIDALYTASHDFDFDAYERKLRDDYFDSLCA